MGNIVDTLKYEFPVTALQFDSRKVIACTGENGVEVRIPHHPLERKCLSVPSRALGIQSHFRCSYAVNRKRTYQARGTIAFHGQVFGDWRKGRDSKSMGSIRRRDLCQLYHGT